MFIRRIGIDLGTANILVFVPQKGIVVNEPSVIAIEINTGKIISVGEQAKQMIGRVPENINIYRPLKRGVIADYKITEAMIKYFINKIGVSWFFKPEVVISVPSGITSAEKRAVIKAATQGGAKCVWTVQESILAALGAGIPIKEPSGNMVVDIGGGTTEIGVISLGGLVEFELVRIGGDDLDSAILDYIRRTYNMDIGSISAENIKIRIGSALKKDKEQEDNLTIMGNDLADGMPRVITIKTNEITEAIGAPLNSIISGIKRVLQKTKPEISSDIIEKGIVITGGGGMLSNIDKLIHKIVDIPTYIAQDPLLCTIKGTGIALEAINEFKNL